MPLRATSGINSSFPELFRSLGQVAHVLRTRLPLSLLGFGRSFHLKNTVRLACLNHAASVHSEPGSNSPNHTCFDSGVLLESFDSIFELLFCVRSKYIYLLHVGESFQLAALICATLLKPQLVFLLILVRSNLIVAYLILSN